LADKLYPHDPLRELAPGVWLVHGISDIPLHRNMIIVRRPDGDLVLHSAVAMEEAGLNALAELGRPRMAIVPNIGHRRDAPFYKRRFPGLVIVCPAAARAEIERTVPIDATVEEALPPLGWRLHKVPGIKVDEFVYEVPLANGGRMLIANDVFGNANAAEKSLRGRLMAAPALGLGDRFGIPRIFRWRYVADMPAVKRFAGELARTPHLRVVAVSHGDPITVDPASHLRAVAA